MLWVIWNTILFNCSISGSTVLKTSRLQSYHHHSQSLVPAYECGTHAVKLICATFGVRKADTQTWTGLPVLSPEPGETGLGRPIGETGRVEGRWIRVEEGREGRLACGEGWSQDLLLRPDRTPWPSWPYDFTSADSSSPIEQLGFLILPQLPHNQGWIWHRPASQPTNSSLVRISYW